MHYIFIVNLFFTRTEKVYTAHH